jgi:hypothetical protein
LYWSPFAFADGGVFWRLHARFWKLILSVVVSRRRREEQRKTTPSSASLRRAYLESMGFPWVHCRGCTGCHCERWCERMRQALQSRRSRRSENGVKACSAG